MQRESRLKAALATTSKPAPIQIGVDARMAEEGKRVASYFVVCGLPPPENQRQLDEFSAEVNFPPEVVF